MQDSLSQRVVRFLCPAISAAVVAAAVASPALAQPANQVLRIGAYDFPPGRGNPYSSVPGIPHIYVWAALFDTLTYVDGKGAAQPGLAVSWKSLDKDTWQIGLRPNVKFANGEVLDAQAMVANVQWMLSEDGQKTVGGRTFNYIDSLRATDNLTVEVKMKSPRPIFPNQISAMYLVPPAAWKDMGIDRFANAPVGTGPYKTQSYGGEEVVLTAFEESWRAPKIRTLRYTKVPDNAARVQALISDQVDVIIRVTTDDIKAIEGAGGTVDIVPSPTIMSLGLTLDNPSPGVDIKPLLDKRVRQALNYAVDKESINNELMAGKLGIMSQIATPNAFGYNFDLKPYPYDPAKARQLLAEAGYANGFSFVAEALPDYSNVFAKMAQDLGKVGVKVEVRTIVFADWLKKFLGGGWEGAGLDLSLGVAPEIDAARPFLFHSCRKTPAYYCNKDQLPLLDAIDQEFDVEKRRQLLNRLMADVREEASVIMLLEQKELNAYGKRVRNFKNVNRFISFHDITLAN